MGTDRRSERVVVAEDLADLFDLASDVPAAPSHEAFRRVLRRHVQTPTPVRVSEVAEALNVSLPTVRAWISHGALEEMPETTPRAVTAFSLGWALHVTRATSDPHVSKRQMYQVLESLYDRDVFAAAQSTYASLDESEFVPYTEDDFAAIRTSA